MAEFVSDIKTILHNDADVYTILSDLNNLELVRDRIPEDKIKEFSFDKDSVTITVDPVGKVKFNVVEREPSKTIKFESEQLPFTLTMWIQLVSKGEADTKMKLTLKADLNPFIKPMVSKPLQQGLDKVADTLAQLPYGELINRGKE
ncbi:SRPBCC family protein [Dysgonomonas sp. 25]|uniref:SRPBCC family protein n=1 Tax=Dysgonomonas sp. 25 TaxID=2302933 RepID=UPI0013D0A059|nr:SRPBCC family protein [Dysgonomonas sp. 25]NDV68247.1 SRPBCC family protein [Dysgonomonas sp. 25]